MKRENDENQDNDQHQDNNDDGDPSDKPAMKRSRKDEEEVRLLIPSKV